VLTSTRPARAEDPSTYTVLIVDNDGAETEREFPAALVESLDLPVNSFGIAPPTLDPELPRTIKSRFQLQYNVTLADGSTRSIPTTTPESVGVAMLFFLLGLFGRNMMYSGSPLSIEPTGVSLPKAQAAAGAPMPPSSGQRKGGRKGPPPGRKRRGRGRR
jgi:hypothetical protein